MKSPWGCGQGKKAFGPVIQGLSPICESKSDFLFFRFRCVKNGGTWASEESDEDDENTRENYSRTQVCMAHFSDFGESIALYFEKATMCWLIGSGTTLSFGDEYAGGIGDIHLCMEQFLKEGHTRNHASSINLALGPRVMELGFRYGF
ncbi:unnamed protein product [Vicia faba]|uniref:Uncharacterized protein n=1 Tax=Vicia faba TaxID=3906 RepID=A0AAV0ZEM4_VICFA|nr:unnamed protein product [Vicia faba]